MKGANGARGVADLAKPQVLGSDPHSALHRAIRHDCDPEWGSGPNSADHHSKK